jgi:two-component system NarL family sensor kinase
MRARSRKVAEAANAAMLADTMQQAIDDLPEQIAILDGNCKILAVNHAWTDVVRAHSYAAMPGDNYREFCVESASKNYEPAVEAIIALDEIWSGKRTYWQLVYNGKDRWEGRDFQICFRKMHIDIQELLIVTRFDLTEILELRRLKDQYSNNLHQQQTIERQRLGRELHDSTSQVLAAIGLLLGRLKDQPHNAQASDLVEEMQDLVGEAQREIRSISYLAHPPSLEKLGLIGAIRGMIEGFARRTGLEASFEIQGSPVPLLPTAESALYRLTQEALSNVHRHARAKRIRLVLCFRRSAIHFIVADDGIGIPQNILAGTHGSGVGLASMRERLTEIDGRLSTRRLDPGTAIIASVRLKPLTVVRPDETIEFQIAG